MWIITDQSLFITRLGGGGEMLDFGGSHGFQGKWRRNQSMKGGGGELIKIDSQ